MRFTLAAAFLIAVPAFAQTPPKPPECPPPPPIALPQYEERLNNLAAGISRDGFITGKVVAAAGALQDFQVNVAVQKAIDDVTEAQKRGAEKPQASAIVMNTLRSLFLTLQHARDQGSSADLVALRREALRDSHYIQYELFREIDLARRERQQIVMLYTTLTRLDQQLEASMVDSLGSMFESVRSGSTPP